MLKGHQEVQTLNCWVKADSKPRRLILGTEVPKVERKIKVQTRDTFKGKVRLETWLWKANLTVEERLIVNEFT